MKGISPYVETPIVKYPTAKVPVTVCDRTGLEHMSSYSFYVKPVRENKGLTAQ